MKPSPRRAVWRMVCSIASAETAGTEPRAAVADHRYRLVDGRQAPARAAIRCSLTHEGTVTTGGERGWGSPRMSHDLSIRDRTEALAWRSGTVSPRERRCLRQRAHA